MFIAFKKKKIRSVLSPKLQEAIVQLQLVCALLWAGEQAGCGRMALQPPSLSVDTDTSHFTGHSEMLRQAPSS